VTGHKSMPITGGKCYGKQRQSEQTVSYLHQGIQKLGRRKQGVLHELLPTSTPTVNASRNMAVVSALQANAIYATWTV